MSLTINTRIAAPRTYNSPTSRGTSCFGCRPGFHSQAHRNDTRSTKWVRPMGLGNGPLG